MDNNLSIRARNQRIYEALLPEQRAALDEQVDWLERDTGRPASNDYPEEEEHVD